jgi:hypothetical protein
MNELWEAFDKIWAKGKENKMVQRLMAKCIQRKLKPTEENCRDYWMGYVRYYVDGWTGQGHHVNPRRNKILMKQLRRNKDDKSRYKKGGRRPPHKMGGSNSKKKHSIQRRK